MLPARNRMTRSTEFSTTVSQGVRAVQPDLVVHAARVPDDPSGPRVGLIVARSVGNAVVRHRVARRLRHIARSVLNDLDPTARLVIRARAGAGAAASARLERQLHEALRRAHHGTGVAR